MRPEAKMKAKFKAMTKEINRAKVVQTSPKPSPRTRIRQNTALTKHYAKESALGTRVQKRLRIPKTPLMAAFSNLHPNWRAYIRYVEIAARDYKDELMNKFLAVYRQRSRNEQQSDTPEFLCDISGITPSQLLASIVPVLYEYSDFTASVIKGVYRPRVLKRMAQAASGMSQRDRETFLKITGDVPTHKGSVTINAPSAIAGAQATMPVLSSAGKKVLELDRDEWEDTELDPSGGASEDEETEE